MRYGARLLIWLVWWVWVSPTAVQGITYPHQGKGYKLVRNYTPEESIGQPQNWWILQDRRGLLYVANQEDLLEFDGQTWHHIPVPNLSTRSLALDGAGTVYVGGINELGFLQADARGALRFQSLLSYIPAQNRDFGTVWKTIAGEDGIYFCTSDYLFRWSPRSQKMTGWQPQKNLRFNSVFSCLGTLYVHEQEGGLRYLSQDRLVSVGGKETFANQKIYMMVPYETRQILIGTRDHGFYLWDGFQAQKFATEADGYLQQNELYDGVALKHSPGDFALATRRGGVVIIDKSGRIRQVMNREYGLQDPAVKHIFEDGLGNLWLAQNTGISKIEYTLPFSIYDHRAGLTGLVLAVKKYGDRIYAGTYGGLFYLAPERDGRGETFQQVPGLTDTCWWILPTAEGLLVATSQGVFQVQADSSGMVRQSLPGLQAFVLVRSAVRPGRVWVGTARGLVSLTSEPVHGTGLERVVWREEFRFPQITQEIRTMAEDRQGNLWLGLRAKNLIRVRVGEERQGVERVGAPELEITRFDAGSGLPAGEVQVFALGDHIVLATEKGLFRPDVAGERMVPDHCLGPLFAGGASGRPVFRLTQTPNGEVWFHSATRNYQAIPQAGGIYTVVSNPLLQLPAMRVNQIEWDGASGLVWFAGQAGLLVYDMEARPRVARGFKAMIREVLVQGKSLYGGEGPMGSGPDLSSTPIVPYPQRNLRFRFAAPFFWGEKETVYQWLLEGYESEWSDWSGETQKDYTNLDYGNGVFRVRARNVFGTISSEAVFYFRVLPPWYKTWWAFLIYLGAGFLLVFGVVFWRYRRVQFERQKLERIIQQRTGEVEDKNRLLEVQAERLKELSLAKSTFFANISHEFRTPLTLLLGPLEQMIQECPQGALEKKQQLTMMLRNAQRLLRLINQLLDLSRLDSGKLELKVRLTRVVPLLKGIVSPFQLLAQQNELDLFFQAMGREPVEDMLLYLDPAKMEDIMSNLLINAIKFTPAGGRVTVTVRDHYGVASESGNTLFPEGSVEVAVTDTGQGIPADQLSHVFNRFYQVKNGTNFQRGGAGIGLALVRELVELHHGTISVKSKEGEGTTFSFLLPYGRQHLTDGEILGQGEVPVQQERPDYRVPREFQPLPWQKREQETEEHLPEWDGMELEEETEVRRELVLVVEDNTDVRQYVKGALQPEYTVLEASDGAEGLRKAREAIPDLIVSDIMMPEMDGFLLCRTLKNDVATSHIPIILLTAKASEQSIVEGLETGADDYVIKPFNTHILLARIRNLIQLRQHLQRTLSREMTLQPAKMDVSPIDREFIADLKKVIEENLGDPEFNVEQLCRKLYLSRPTVYRKILALSGESPTDFIRSYRLKRAAELLGKNRGTVLEVALEVGFSSATYFTKCFKKKFHQLPSQFAVRE